MKLFLLACVSFVLLNRVSSSLDLEEPLLDTHEPFIEYIESNVEDLEPERRREIVGKYLDSLPNVEHWINPHDMLGSSMIPTRKEMNAKDPEPIVTEGTVVKTSSNMKVESSNSATNPEVQEPLKTDCNKPPTGPKMPEIDLKKPENDVKKPETGSSNVAPDSCKASSNPNEQKSFCALDSIYVTRWIKKLLYRIENETSTISFYLDASTLASLREMSNDKLFQISTFDDIISNLLSQAAITTEQPLTMYRTFTYFSDALWVILYGLGICGIVYVVHCCFTIHPYKTLFGIIVIVSVMWHWLHLYKQQVAIQHAELASMEIPTQCRKHDLGLFEHINEYLKSWFATNDCAKYYEALLVDPALKVTISMAISETFTAFVFQPLYAGSRAVNVCIKQLFDGLPIHLTLALIVFIFFLALMLHDYAIYIPFSGIQPARRIAGSGVEEVRQPSLMQNVARAVRNAISDNQGPTVEDTQAEVPTGSSNTPSIAEVPTGSSNMTSIADVPTGSSNTLSIAEVPTGSSNTPSIAKVSTGSSNTPSIAEVSTGSSNTPPIAKVSNGLSNSPSTAEVSIGSSNTPSTDESIKPFTNANASKFATNMASNMNVAKSSEKPSPFKSIEPFTSINDSKLTKSMISNMNVSKSPKKPSTSKSIEPFTSANDSEFAPSMASNVKVPEEENSSIESGYLNEDPSEEPEHSKLKVDVTILKTPENISLSKDSAETIPKTLAIEDTPGFDAFSSTDVPSSAKTDEEDEEVSNLKNVLSDSFEVLPIPTDEEIIAESLLSSTAGPNCDTSMDMIERYHIGCRYCR